MRMDSVSRPLSTTQALKGASVMPAPRSVVISGPLTMASGPQMAPASTRPWPSRYLVPEWMMRSAPRSTGFCSAGVQKQLSTASRAPAACAISASAAMSQTSVSGLLGVSAKKSLVLGLTAERQAPTSVCDTKVVSTPNLPNWACSSVMVEPNTLCEHTMWSPDLSRPMTSSKMALMPLDVAMAASVPSSAARRRSNIIVVGLAKRAAAVAASGWLKLLVKNSASEFSPHCVGGRPSRTASVSMRASGGRSLRGRRFLSSFWLSDFAMRPPLNPAPLRRPGCGQGSFVAVALQGQARVDGFFLALLRQALRLDGGEVLGADVTRDVGAIEARGLETLDLGVQPADDLLHRIDVLVDQGVGTDDLAHLFERAAMGHEFALGRHVDAVDVGKTHGRRSRGQVDLVGASLSSHLHDFLGGGAAHDGVVDQQHVAAFEFQADGVELLAHGLLARALPRHDEGAAHVAVLDEAFAVGLAELLSQLHGRGAARFGDGDHHVDLAGRHGRDDALRQGLAHVQARLVDRDAIDGGVRPGQVDVLEHAGVEHGLLGALLGVHHPVQVDEQGLARGHVAHEAVAGAFQGHRLAGDHDFAAFRQVGLAVAHGADAEGVAEGHQAVTGDQADDGVRALDALVHGAHGLEDGGGRQGQLAAGQLQLVGEHVEQHLRVAVCVEVAAIDVEQLLAQVVRIRQVAP